MKFPIVIASALGLGMVEVGVAAPSESRLGAGSNNSIRLAYNDAPYQGSQSIRKHRPTKKYRVSNDATSRYRHQTASRRHSSGKFHGLKRAFPKRISPPGVRLFIFSPRRKAWAAYTADGRLVGYGRASGGANWCKDIGRSCRTPRGTFRIFSRGSPGCRSSRYPKPRGGAPMPYCMFFSKYYAIHGSPHVPNYNASHGCIRVKPHAAKWLRYNFITIGTRVVVTSY